MAHSFECKHLERGIFQVNLLDNKILIWSSLACALTVFPAIYIPVINDYAFQMTGIGYEWGLIAAALIIFMTIVEVSIMSCSCLCRLSAVCILTPMNSVR